MQEAIDPIHDYGLRVKLTAREAARFWAKIDATSNPDECWNWTAGLLHNIYGKFGLRGKTVIAHRLAWSILHCIPMPEQCVCHKCDNPLCCNTEHHWLGTKQENNKDRDDKKRQASGNRVGAILYPEKYRGEANGHARLNADIVRAIRRRYSEGGIAFPALAAEFGISRSHCGAICKGTRWHHVD